MIAEKGKLEKHLGESAEEHDPLIVEKTKLQSVIQHLEKETEQERQLNEVRDRSDEKMEYTQMDTLPRTTTDTEQYYCWEGESYCETKDELVQSFWFDKRHW